MKFSAAALFASCAAILPLVVCQSARAVWNSTIAASNPLDWYRFDELSGSTAIDYGSAHLNGTYGAGPLDATRGVPGLVGTAEQFGDQSTIVLSGSDITGDWSAEFVVKRTGSKASSVLIRGVPFAFPSSALKLEQYPNTEQIGYTKYGQIDATYSPAIPSPLNQWIDLVYANKISNNTVSVYVNGVLAGTRNDNFDLNRYQIGSPTDTVPESPLAIMDEAVLYNRALTPTEIASHFAAVPEPASWILLGLALITLAALRKSSSTALTGPST